MVEWGKETKSRDSKREKKAIKQPSKNSWEIEGKKCVDVCSAGDTKKFRNNVIEVWNLGQITRRKKMLCCRADWMEKNGGEKQEWKSANNQTHNWIPSKRMNEWTEHRAQLNEIKIDKTLWMFTIFFSLLCLTLLHWESKTHCTKQYKNVYLQLNSFLSSRLWIFIFPFTGGGELSVFLSVQVFMQFCASYFPIHFFIASILLLFLFFSFLFMFLSHFLEFSNCCVLDAKPLNVINSISYLPFYYLIRES